MAPRIYFNDGQEITHEDLNKVSQAVEKEVLDRVLYEIGNRQEDFFFGDSMKVTYVNATTVQVAVGSGVQTDNTQVDPEPVKRLLHVASATNKTLSAADPSNPRIDIVSIKADRATYASDTRNFKDADTDEVSEESMVIETDWVSTLLVTAGTPAGSPAVPSTPAGYIKLCEIAVSASSGVANQAAITDKRTRYKKPSSFKSIVTKTGAYTLDLDDEVVRGNVVAGGFTLTLPDATLCSGKEFEIFRVGDSASANVLTIGTTSAQSINDTTSKTLDYQYSMMRVRSNGTGYDIVG